MTTCRANAAMKSTAILHYKVISQIKTMNAN